MAVKNTDYYLDLGIAHAKQGVTEHPFPREANSWQARTYWAGFTGKLTRNDAGEIRAGSPTTPPTPAEKTLPDANLESGAPSPTGRSASATPPVFQNLPIRTPEVAALINAFKPKIDGVLDLSGWPDAPRSHYLALGKQLDAETEPARINRLSAAMNRMIARWGAK